MALNEACRVCGGKPFHKLGCPVLTKVSGAAALLFAGVTVCLALWDMAGGPSGNIALGVALAAFFTGYWFLSRRARARRT